MISYSSVIDTTFQERLSSDNMIYSKIVLLFVLLLHNIVNDYLESENVTADHFFRKDDKHITLTYWRYTYLARNQLKEIFIRFYISQHKCYT